MSGMFLNLAAMGVGMHMSAWRFRNEDPFSYLDLEFYKDIATRVEKAGFHGLFLADTLTASEENFERPNYGAVDPTIILAALSSVTESIGLIATATTSFTDPYTFARRFATLDQISRGRVGWNIVTTYLPAVAANFGASDLPKGQERYAMAEEFVDVVDALWKSWTNEAKIGDREGGVFANAELIQPIDYVGKYYKVKGIRLYTSRSPRRRARKNTFTFNDVALRL
jgi:alkanesulfonate monooxygenase SsuD/methylene tetrahydromethanopterin reductase-like flavin-dependent oxidoreductase (luciferase family)